VLFIELIDAVKTIPPAKQTDHIDVSVYENSAVIGKCS